MQIKASALRMAILCALATGAMAAASTAWAQQRNFNIPASDAASALPEYARQAGVQIVAPGEQLAGRRTPAINGSMDVHAALRTLLAGTGLKVVSDDGRTITLGPISAQPSTTAPPTPARSVPPTSSAAPNQITAGSVAIAAEPVAPSTRVDTSSAPTSATTQTLDNITVTGSFIRNVDTETALPITTITQTDIDLSGAANVADLLAQLPQSAAFDNSQTSTGPNDARGDADSINLRGIGSGNTLVLLNGRRIAPHPISAGEVPRLSSNINQIPLGAVERIEILRDGASATYGSDAVAGVVNTILKKNYQGLEAEARYGHVGEGGMGERSASILGGVNSADNRTNIMGFVSVYNRNSLQASDKSYMETGDLRDRANSTSTLWDNRSISSPYGNFTTGVINANGNFTARRVPGRSSNNFYMNPDGSVGSGSLPRDLRYDYTPDYMVLPQTERVQAYTAFNHRFDNDIEAYAEAFVYDASSYISNATTPISANSDNGIYVPRTNYYNPFGTRFYGPGTANPTIAASDVLIANYRPTELGLRGAEVDSKAYQVVGGFRGRFAGSWHWDASAEYGKGKTTDIGTNMISESRLRQQLALNTPDAFNPFGGPGGNTAAALEAVRIETWRKGTAGLGLVDANATGELFDLPAGSVQLAVGVQYRHETYSDRRDDLSNGDDVIAQSKSADSDGSRSVKSAFAELYVPIFSEQNAIPGFQRLELSLAGRSENYSDFGTATKPKVSMAWSPFDALLLRASRSEGFRAPTLAQVFVGEIARRNSGTPDPYRADVVGSPADLGDESRQVIRGGNKDLGPEEAKEISAGFVFQVPFAEGLSISADYFKIRQSDVIDTFGEADQLALDFLLRTTGQGGNPDVVRLPVTPEDAARFAAFNAANPNDQRTPVGAVDFVRDTFINIAQRKVSGIDFGLDYKLRETALGNFTFKSNIAYFDKFEEQKDVTSPSVGQLQINGLPRVRGMASVAWSRDRLSAGLRANYVGDLMDTSAPKLEDGSNYRVSSYTTFNSYVGVRVGKERNSYLRFGINNLFDRDPPLADEDRTYFDEHANPGRFYYIDWKFKL